MPSSFLRLCGAANIVGGVAIAIFVLSHPWGHFVGADVALTSGWRLAHTFHFIGAAAPLLGLVGLYAVQADRLGRPGVGAFVVAFTGTAMFVGSGMLTAFVWPMVAAHAPDTVAHGGAMFDMPAIAALALTAIILAVGYVMFAAVSWRAHVLPHGGLLLWSIGGALGMVPPQPLGPLFWAGLVSAGVIYAVGAAWLGRAVLDIVPASKG
jgi:hypothetical protein